jgi:membrane associated rhomboid family serine protease
MFRNLTPTVRALLAANVGVYLLQAAIGDAAMVPFALWPLHASDLYGMPDFRPWQLVTYGFMHGSPAHLFFNMLALYMFGPDVERLLGSARFRVFYLVCVVGAGLTQIAAEAWLYHSGQPTVGASGGIFGLLLCYGLAYPQRRIILLFPPIPLPAWLFVTLYGLLELYMGVSGSGAGVAHFAHLGGMAAGYVLLRLWRAQARGRPPL